MNNIKFKLHQSILCEGQDPNFVFTANADKENSNLVIISWTEEDGSFHYVDYTEEQVKRYLSEGSWIRVSESEED